MKSLTFTGWVALLSLFRLFLVVVVCLLLLPVRLVWRFLAGFALSLFPPSPLLWFLAS